VKVKNMNELEIDCRRLRKKMRLSEYLVDDKNIDDEYDADSVPLVRWLVLQGLCPNRKAAASIISSSIILVNDQVVTSLAHQIETKDVVKMNDLVITSARKQHTHYMLHKPPGCLSSRRNKVQTKDGSVIDDSRPTVYDYLTEDIRTKVHCIGRLDIDTSGLLLFTSDGMLHHCLASPQFHVDKIYRCTLRSPGGLSEDSIAQLDTGVQLPHAKGAIVRGKAWNVKDNIVDLCIQGGFKHQVKLMMKLIQKPLRLLHRRIFANLTLPEDLPEGESRPLTSGEVEQLYILAREKLEFQKKESIVEDTFPLDSKEAKMEHHQREGDRD
jgi:16S rRNA pseudouridine516 synthase